MDNTRIQNQGLSLVELLVAVAVLALAMTGIIGMINIAARYYSYSNKEVELQDELQKTFTIVSSMLVDADKGITALGSDGYVATHTAKKYGIVKNGSNLYIKQFGASETVTAAGCIGDANLLADHVTTFKMDLSHYEEGYVVLALRISYGSRTAYMSKNVYLRNAASGYDNVITKCDIKREAPTEVGGQNQIEFKITQKTGGKWASGTTLTIVARLVPTNVAMSASSLGLAGDVSLISVKYNPATGVATFKAKVSTDWADNTQKSVKIKYPKTATLNTNISYITGIGK